MTALPTQCPNCGGALIARHRDRLLWAGGLFVLIAVAAILVSLWLLLPAILCALIGWYLLTWGTSGRGLWCRTCKRFPTKLHVCRNGTNL
ncbi:MAG TPA: hypothetical protein VGM17_01795 [Rhizomicrobium sp.]|jgi:hypothetical protein